MQLHKKLLSYLQVRSGAWLILTQTVWLGLLGANSKTHICFVFFLHFLYLSYFNICSTPSSFLPTGVKLDPSKAWCPVLECQAVCSLQPSTEGRPTAVPCLTCHAVFCSGCRGPWQDGHTCPERQPMMSPSPSHESRSVRRPLTAATQLRVFVRTKRVTAVNKLLT